MSCVADIDLIHAERDIMRKLPAMQRGFTIETENGPLHIGEEEAATVTAAVGRVLRARVKRLEQMRQEGAA